MSKRLAAKPAPQPNPQQSTKQERQQIIKRQALRYNDWQSVPDFSACEEMIADYWQGEKIFQRSLEQTAGGKEYVFYDGPPFATGLPHYGHLVASTTKDVFPRFHTMRGKHVERIWGWDCHGLPIENIIEKELNLPDKKALEKFGVSKFCESCRSKVDLYADAWKKTVKRLGRFVDMDNAYRTMDSEFMDSEWRVFARLWEKGLVYQGHKSMHVCPRCATALSNFEVTLGYKEVSDWSVIALFKLKQVQKLGLTGDVFALAWTTTPWTLPGNFLLAVNPQATYVVVSYQGEHADKPQQLLLAKERLEILGEREYQILKEFSGEQLVGLSYQPLMPYFADTPKAFLLAGADFVTLTEGTGIVHTAPAYGEDDFKLGQQMGLPIIHHVDLTGHMVEQVTDFAKMSVRHPSNPAAVDVAVIKYLAAAGKLFSKKKIKHSYPHCWRCDHPLLNYATSSWFIKVSAIKKQLLEANKKINWLPAHFRDGRMGDWLEHVRDWAISRGRYWGTPIPVWQSEDGQFLCIGSKAELEKLLGHEVNDLHKHFVDQLVIEKDGKKYQRIPEVFDCWFESGSMPFFGKHFPADFISEGQDQTRGWFYTLLVLAVALENQSSYKNVLVSGVILAEDGKKMSKKLQNYPNPDLIFQKYGADALRLYLMTSPVMKAESLNFSEKDVARLRRQVLLTTWNVLTFGQLLPKFAESKVLDLSPSKTATHFLDDYLLARLRQLVEKTTRAFEAYQIINAGRYLIDFADELSNFYLRLSRERLKEDEGALAVLKTALYYLSLLFAPIMPFFAELLYQNLGGSKDSVHLEAWPEMPKLNKEQKDKDAKLFATSVLLKQIISTGQAKRRELSLKVRQPLARVVITLEKSKKNLLEPAVQTLIKQALNVKAIELKLANGASEPQVELDSQLTPALIAEGQARELMRTIAGERKKLGLKASEPWEYQVNNIPDGWQERIEKHTNTKLVIAAD